MADYPHGWDLETQRRMIRHIVIIEADRDGFRNGQAQAQALFDSLWASTGALAERAVKLCAEDMEDSGFTVIPNFKECVARARRELAAEKEQSDG
jgi:hypothetical protein